MIQKKEVIIFNQDIKSESTIVNFDRSFENIPNILVGITKYVLGSKSLKIPLIKIEVLNVYNNQFQLKSKYNPDILDLAAEVLAYDSQRVQNVFTVNNLELRIQDNDSTNLISFEESIKQIKGKKIVKVFLTGFAIEQKDQNPIIKELSFNIKVGKIQQDSFELKVESSQPFIQIFYNYIVLVFQDMESDVIVENQLFIAKFDSYSDSCLILSSKNQSECRNLISNKTPQALVSSQAIDSTKTDDQQQSKLFLVFVGLNCIKIDLQNQQLSLNILKDNLINISNFQQAVQNWNQEIKDKIIEEVFVIQSLFYCSKDYLFEFNGICKDACPINYYPDILNKRCNLCKDITNCKQICSAKQFYLSDINACSNSKPIWYFCYFSNEQGYSICKQCSKDEICNKCKLTRDTISCNQCSLKKFYLEGQCFYDKPEDTYCNSYTNECQNCLNRGCQECSLGVDNTQHCLKCQEGYCFGNVNDCIKDGGQSTCVIKNECKLEYCSLCDSNDITLCQICEKGFYNFSQICYKKEELPKNSIYCDEQKYECYECPNNCAKCTNPKEKDVKCLECSSFTCLYENKCYYTDKNKLPKDVVYDPLNQICGKCLFNNCDVCDVLNNPNTKCIVCKTGYYLYNGQCIEREKIKSIVFCDEQMRYCFNCPNLCKECSDPRLIGIDEGSCNICEDGSNLFEGNCYICSIPNCLACKDSVKCLQCDSNYYLFNQKCVVESPKNAYCDEKLKCLPCRNPLCNKCLIDLTSCDSCLADDQISNGNKECSCRDQHKFIDSNGQCKECSQYCKTCSKQSDQCTSCGLESYLDGGICKCQQGYGLVNSSCQKCYNEKILQENGFPRCLCLQQGYFLRIGSQTCESCNIENCSKCSSDGETCDTCKEGFIQKQGNKLCKQCGRGKYDDPTEQKRCSKSCQPKCLLCSGPNKCDQFEDNAIFYGDDCHYTCSKCYTKSQYECIQCNSLTREFKISSNSCPCKDGYYEVGSADCKKDLLKSFDRIIEQMSENMMKASFFITLPQSFININPLNDSMIVPLQIVSIIPLTQKDYSVYTIFSIFNFFNFYIDDEKDQQQPNTAENNTSKENSSKLALNKINNQQQDQQYNLIDNNLSNNQRKLEDDSSQQNPQNQKINNKNNSGHINNSAKNGSTQVYFIKLRNSLSYQLSENLIFMAIIWTFGILGALIVYLLKVLFNIQHKKLQDLFIWNFSIKIIRITSLYVLLSCFYALSQLKKQSIISIILLNYLLLIYAVYLVTCWQKCRYRDYNSFSNLYHNLSYEYRFERYFWFILEIKKIVLIIPAHLISSLAYTYFSILVSIATIISLIKFRSKQNYSRDLIYMVINEIFLVILLSLPLIVNQNSLILSEESQVKVIRYSSIIIFIFGLFQFYIAIEFMIRTMIIKRKQQIKDLVKQNAQQAVIVDDYNSFDLKNLDSILNTTTWIKSQTHISWAKKNKQNKSEIEL